MLSRNQKRLTLCAVLYLVCFVVPIRCLNHDIHEEDGYREDTNGYSHFNSNEVKNELYTGQQVNSEVKSIRSQNQQVSNIYKELEDVTPLVTPSFNNELNVDNRSPLGADVSSVTHTPSLLQDHEQSTYVRHQRVRKSISESPVDRAYHEKNHILPSAVFREDRAAVLPTLTNLKVSGRQSNVESNIDDIIHGIMKLLGGNVKITTADPKDTKLTTFSGRNPATIRSRINNRGPPRLDSPFGFDPNRPRLTRPPIGRPSRTENGELPYVANTRPPFLVPLPPQLTFNNPLNKPFMNGVPLPVNNLPSDTKEGPSILPTDELVSTEQSFTITDQVEMTEEETQSPDLESTLDDGIASTTSTNPTPSLDTSNSMQTSASIPLEIEASTNTRESGLILVTNKSSQETVVTPSVFSTLSLSIEKTSLPIYKSSQSRIPPRGGYSTFDHMAPPSAPPKAIFTYPSIPTRLPDPIRPLMTTGHPGMVIEDSVSPHVITAPLPERNIFDVTVSAIQGYNGGGRPVLQRPVNLGGALITTAATPGDGVFIDGRKSYFNLVPVTGANHIQQTLGVGTVIPEQAPIAPYLPSGDLPPGRLTPAAKRPSPLNRPGSYRPSVVNKPSPPSSKPKKEPQNHVTLGPPKRIDTCIVGYDTTCKKQLGEVCRTEGDVSSCFCKPGTARKRARTKCQKSVVLHLSLKVDRVGDRRILWGVNYANPEAREYQILSYEAEKALDSAFQQARGMTNLYLGSTVNKFYSLGGRVIVNSTVLLKRTPQTSSSNIRKNIQRHLIRVIQANHNYVGNSVLVVEGPLNPIPDVSDVNECFEPVLNDCHADASCINTFGGFTCTCQQGYTDRNSDDPDQSGRTCLTCSSDFCTKRGTCKVLNKEKVCECEDSFYGSRCEIDGEVIAVAVGASVAAVVIIILTLIFLCMWSRRWKDQDRKAQIMSSAAGFFGWRNRLPADGGYSMNIHSKGGANPAYGAALEDRIRWSHMADSLAQQNIYAQPDQMRPALPMYQEQRKMGLPPSEYASVGTVRSSFPQQFGMHVMNQPTYGPMHNNGPASFSQFTSTSINAASVGGVSRAPTLGARTPQTLIDSRGIHSMGPLGGGVVQHLSLDMGASRESSEDDDRPYHLPRPKSRGSLAVGADTSRLGRSYNSLLF